MKKTLIIIGLVVILVGMIIAGFGTLAMDAVPPLNHDFEVTSSKPVPENGIAILVPIGTVFTGFGACIAMLGYVAREP